MNDVFYVNLRIYFSCLEINVIGMTLFLDADYD